MLPVHDALSALQDHLPLVPLASVPGNLLRRRHPAKIRHPALVSYDCSPETEPNIVELAALLGQPGSVLRDSLLSLKPAPKMRRSISLACTKVCCASAVLTQSASFCVAAVL